MLTDKRRAKLLAVLETLQSETPYAQGVIDLLELMGLTDAEAGGGRAAPTGEVTGMALESLKAHLRDGIQIGPDWNDLSRPAPRGVDILRAIEEARLAAVDAPTPGRVVTVTQGVIKKRLGDVDHYLMQYDRHAGQYQPIGGKVDPADADPAEALRREMMEELALGRLPGPADCALSPIGTDWHTTRLSATYGILTGYTFHFYQVTIAAFTFPTEKGTRWLSRAEIVNGQAADGRAISTIYPEALGWPLLDGLAPLPGG